eukprot:120516-Rhodomonas_salina.1
MRGGTARYRLCVAPNPRVSTGAQQDCTHASVLSPNAGLHAHVPVLAARVRSRYWLAVAPYPRARAHQCRGRAQDPSVPA